MESAGIVDFDVLDGLDEFWNASRRLDLKACIGLESRVFVPEFSDRVINSPGEPGICYHMGAGFTTTDIPQDAQDFLDGMKRTSGERNQSLLDRVNAFLSPLTLDYEKDVLPLTPKGNATERHLCLAYARKAAVQFPEESALRAFWSDKLGVAPEDLKDVPDGRGMTDLIRAKTMKKGGVGYVQPDSGSFPNMAEMNEFVLTVRSFAHLDLAGWLFRWRAGDSGAGGSGSGQWCGGVQYYTGPELHSRVPRSKTEEFTGCDQTDAGTGTAINRGNGDEQPGPETGGQL